MTWATVYYNDTGISGGTGPNPLTALRGVSSATGAHSFSNSWGDAAIIDTWAYYPSQRLEIPGGITVASADLEILKTHSPNSISIGQTITYTLTVTNKGSYNAVGVKVTDTLPTGINGATWICTVTTGPGSCGTSSGSGNINAVVINLNLNSVITFTITGTIDPNYAQSTISNTATVTRSSDANDPVLTNNTATDVATILRTRIRIVKRITAINSTAITTLIDPTTTTDPNDNAANWPVGYLVGVTSQNAKATDSIQYTIYFLSDGSSSANNVNLCDFIPLNSTYVANTIQRAIGPTVTNLTDSTLDADGGKFITPPPTVPDTYCTGLNNSKGAVAVQLGVIPNATGPGTPNTSYGYIRFRATVN